MKRMLLITMVAGLALASWPVTVLAQEGKESGIGERLGRMEQQIHQLTERIERAAPPLGQQPMVSPQMARQMPMPQMQQPPQLMPPMPQCPMNSKGGCPGFLKVLLPLFAVINILLAVWVFTDIRKRGEGHGIFIVLALIAGLPGAILYALVRLGDRVGEKKT